MAYNTKIDEIKVLQKYHETFIHRKRSKTNRTMKILELRLKKDVLIVEIPRLADYEFINRECKYLKVGNEEIKLNASTLDKFEFICKGSELTEEIASELVDYWQNMANDGFIFENYKDNIPKKLTANDALISAVESKDKSIDISKCLIFVKK